jgi:hypothetical protein
MKPLSIRERIEVFWSGEQPDRIPFTIYQNEWRHTATDPRWQPLYEKGLGVTWHIATVQEQWTPGIEMVHDTWTADGRLHERHTVKTPVGEIYDTLIDGWQKKYFLETTEDYRVMIHVVRNTILQPVYEAYEEKSRQIGPYGIPLLPMSRTPLQSILVDFVGLEKFAYQLVDLHDEMMELYDALLGVLRRKVELVAAGPGRFVSVLENFTADSLGPVRYRQLLLPVYQELFPLLQSAGKIVGTHYDGQLSACKRLIAQAPIDLIESLTPPPEGDMSLAECRAAWPDKLFWSNLNVALYYLPPEELKQVVWQRIQEAAPDGSRLAFEVSEQYPDNWFESVGIVLDALEEYKGEV